MRIRINFLAKPSEPGAEPSLISYPTGEFMNLEGARSIALADADKPTIMAHSVIIESLDDLSLSERWTRDEGGWKSVDA